MGVIVGKDRHSCDNSNQDGAVYKGDVEDLCSVSDERTKENLLEEDFSLVEVPSQGTDSLNFSLEQVGPPHQQQLTISVFSKRRLRLTVRPGVSNRSLGTHNLTILHLLPRGRSKRV